MKDFLILNMVDLRRGNLAGDTRKNIIQKFVVPPVKLKKSMRSAGGGVMDINHVQPRLEPLEPAATIFGFDGDLLPGVPDLYTFAASMRRRKDNAVVPVRCTVFGTPSEWTPDEADPAAFNGCNIKWDEVTHFDLLIDGVEHWYIDEDEGVIRRMGIDLAAADRAALGA